jgi:hypothetical protein
MIFYLRCVLVRNICKLNSVTTYATSADKVQLAHLYRLIIVLSLFAISHFISWNVPNKILKMDESI